MSRDPALPEGTYIRNHDDVPHPRVLMIVGDFVEDYEAMVPKQTLEAFGCVVDTVYPDKTRGDTVKTAIHDFEGDQTYSEKPGHAFVVTRDWGSVEVERYAGLVIPGGRAPEFLRLNEDVLAIVRRFFELDRPVASICHGVQLLTAAGVAQGRTLQCYAACAPEAEAAGATVTNDDDVTAVTTEGNLVSAQAWPAHGPFVRQFVTKLGGSVSWNCE